MVKIDWQYFITGEVIDKPTFSNITVKVTPSWGSTSFIEWEDFGGPYTVYSMDSEGGPYRKLTAIPITDTFYVAPCLQDRKFYDELFIVEGQGVFTTPVGPSQQLSRFHWLRWRDIIRRESILLKKFVGVDSVVFTPKIRGPRCSECWDDNTKRTTKDHCRTCYGTSYEGGYHTGMLTKISFGPIDPSMQADYIGNREDIMSSAWTIPYPSLQPHAIVLRLSDRKVFRVEGHRGSTEMLTTVQHQSVVLKELGKNHVENLLFDLPYVDLFNYKEHVHGV
jgi:hypothetical protein